MSADFHPRFDAVSRRYTYLFHDQGRNNPFLNDLAWCTDALDDSAMHGAAQVLLGEHDFSSFRGADANLIRPCGEWIGAKCGVKVIGSL